MWRWKGSLAPEGTTWGWRAHKLRAGAGQDMGWDVDLHLLLMRTWVLCSPHSLGVVLSQGHGEYIFLGNTSVEEGRLAPSTDGQFRGEKGAPGILSRATRARAGVTGSRSWASERTLRARLPGGGTCVSRAPGCAGSAGQPSSPTVPKTCQLCLSESGRLCWLEGRASGR